MRPETQKNFNENLKLQTIIILLLLSRINSFSQENDLIKLAFSDKSNFDITMRLGNKRPAVYYVLTKTENWNTYRFHLDEDLTSDSVIKKLENDEHSPYNHSYIFADTAINRLFSDTEKMLLYKTAKSISPRQITNTFKMFKLVNSFNEARNGFFFSLTDPVFTSDSLYAFIDIITYKKDSETEDINSCYFGMTLLIYQNIKGKGWIRIRKKGYLVL